MRKLVFLFGMVLAVSGCTVNQQIKSAEKVEMRREVNPAKYKELIKMVAFDTNCPEDQIKILDKSESLGSGMYKIEACGKELKYKRMGSVYYAADKSPIPGEK